jgi:hypothetical protein
VAVCGGCFGSSLGFHPVTVLLSVGRKAHCDSTAYIPGHTPMRNQSLFGLHALLKRRAYDVKIPKI